MRYRYRREMVEVEAERTPTADGGATWAVKDRISGTMQVLTEAEFRARFEEVAAEPHERLCIACQHYKFHVGGGERARCQSPKVAISLVDGRLRHGYLAAWGRSDGGLCGRVGIHWEPKG